MDGKRVAAAEKTEEKPSVAGRLALALAILAAVLVGLAAGLCVYANTYGLIFPGVTAADIPLGGMSREEAAAALDRQLPVFLERAEDRVTVIADGETLGIFSQAQLGAAVSVEETVENAWAVGRGGGVLGWLESGWLMLQGRLHGERDCFPPLAYDPAALSALVNTVANEFDRAPLDGSYTLSRAGLFAVKHLDGRVMDRQALIDSLPGAAGHTVEVIYTAVPARPLDMEALAETLDATPLAPRYDVQLGKVVDGRPGVVLEVSAAEFVLSAAAGGERVRLPAEITFPALTAQELEAVLFRDLLATYTTTVTGSSTRKNNIRLAGESINGTVLNDEDVFDYNQVVGQRTTERGFGAAATYINGETVDTVGGGICQVSSTLYMTALLANLTITERYAHRFYPGYITLGMDATVSWGGPEFRFQNNTGYPLRLDVAYAGGKLTTSIYGTKTDDTYVKMTYKLLSTTAYSTTYVDTDQLPSGTQKEKQNGYTGYKVESYRNIYDGSGKLLSSTLEAKSTYKSRDRVVLVGTAGQGPSAPGSGGEETPVLPPEELPEAPPPPVESEKPGWLG